MQALIQNLLSQDRRVGVVAITQVKSLFSGKNHPDGLIDTIQYPDGSTAKFWYRFGKLIKARVGDSYYKISKNSWTECTGSFNGPLNGLGKRIELIQDETSLYPVGTLLLYGGHFFSVISPRVKYSLRFDENGRIENINLGNNQGFLYLEYDDNGRLIAVNGPTKSLHEEPMNGPSGTYYRDVNGDPIRRLSLDAGTATDFLEGKVESLEIIDDPHDYRYGTVITHGKAGDSLVQASYSPDGSSVVLTHSQGTPLNLRTTDCYGNVRSFFHLPSNDGKFQEESTVQLMELQPLLETLFPIYKRA